MNKTRKNQQQVELIMSKRKNKKFYIKQNSQQSDFQGSFPMGPSQSFQNISAFDSFHSLVQRHSKSFLFGPQLQIYKNKFNPKQQFAKHLLKFNDSKAMQHFAQEIRRLIDTKANNVPFSILYPINLFQKEQTSIINNIKTSCSQKTNEVIVIHKWLGNNLYDLIREKNEPMNQKLIWFVLNQLSKSLEILEEKNHASHYLMPQNIWYNQNDNWFLYDGQYVLGSQYLDDFYQKKVKQNEFVSEDFSKKVLSNSIITSYQALQQDVFCLGYCLIFMMTAIHPKQLPLTQHQRDTCINDLLQSITEISSENFNTQTDRLKLLQNDLKQPKYSTQLANFVRNLIKADPKRRYSIRHIRSYLKTKEQQIFMNQQQQWSRTTEQQGDKISSDSKKTTSKFRKTNILKSPQRQDKKIFSQHSQINPKYPTPIRTLKKQPVTQKLVAVKNDNLTRFPISLIENQATHNSRLQEGQITPIKKIQDVRTRRFQQYKTTSNTTFRADQQLGNGQTSIGNRNNNNFIISNTHLVHEKTITFVSPQKHSTSTINPYSTMQSFPQNLPSQHFNSTHIQSSKHITFKSPVHNMYQSPVKVKVNYFSPQKANF